jgi:hypothetical protein
MAKRKRKCRRQATSWRFFSDAWRIEHLQKRQSPRKFWHFRGDCNAFCGIFFRCGYRYLSSPSALTQGRM